MASSSSSVPFAERNISNNQNTSSPPDVIEILDSSDEEEIEKRNKRIIYCRNLNKNVTKEILHELFLQGGPVESVTLFKDRRHATVVFVHQCSVAYCMQLFKGVKLYGDEVLMDTCKIQPPVPVAPRRTMRSLTPSYVPNSSSNYSTSNYSSLNSLLPFQQYQYMQNSYEPPTSLFTPPYQCSSVYEFAWCLLNHNMHGRGSE